MNWGMWQMKKMTKLLLINWLYFEKQLIDFGDINFLTGKNSSGKSTIIDALQVVLLGVTNQYSFNKAASKKSERTLRSYLRGYIGEDISLGDKSLRGNRDFSTYIVCEFYDDVKNELFCLGAVFDSFSDGSEERKRFFYLKSSLPNNLFIVEKKPMNTRDLIGFFRDNYKNKYETKDTNDGYQNIILAKLNVHDKKMFSMLKRAISFEPINDIEKFITDNVCDIEDDIHIEAMQENIEYYKRQELIAEKFEQKLKSLINIHTVYGELENYRSIKIIQQYLIDRAFQQKYIYQLEQLKIDIEKYDCDIEEFQIVYENLGILISELDKEKVQLIEEKTKYWSDQKGELLQQEENSLKNQIEDANKSITNNINRIRTNSIGWGSSLSETF